MDVAGPMWSGPMHDEAFVHAMEEEAATRGWDDAEQLLVERFKRAGGLLSDFKHKTVGARHFQQGHALH